MVACPHPHWDHLPSCVPTLSFQTDSCTSVQDEGGPTFHARLICGTGTYHSVCHFRWIAERERERGLGTPRRTRLCSSPESKGAGLVVVSDSATILSAIVCFLVCSAAVSSVVFFLTYSSALNDRRIVVLCCRAKKQVRYRSSIFLPIRTIRYALTFSLYLNINSDHNHFCKRTYQLCLLPVTMNGRDRGAICLRKKTPA